MKIQDACGLLILMALIFFNVKLIISWVKTYNDTKIYCFIADTLLVIGSILFTLYFGATLCFGG